MGSVANKNDSYQAYSTNSFISSLPYNHSTPQQYNYTTPSQLYGQSQQFIQSPLSTNNSIIPQSYKNQASYYTNEFSKNVNSQVATSSPIGTSSIVKPMPIINYSFLNNATNSAISQEVKINNLDDTNVNHNHENLNLTPNTSLINQHQYNFNARDLTNAYSNSINESSPQYSSSSSTSSSTSPQLASSPTELKSNNSYAAYSSYPGYSTYQYHFNNYYYNQTQTNANNQFIDNYKKEVC